jgi:hypothetical protein
MLYVRQLDSTVATLFDTTSEFFNRDSSHRLLYLRVWDSLNISSEVVRLGGWHTFLYFRGFLGLQGVKKNYGVFKGFAASHFEIQYCNRVVDVFKKSVSGAPDMSIFRFCATV